MKTMAIRDTLVPLETRIPNCLFYNSNATAFLLSTRIKQSRRIPCREVFSRQSMLVSFAFAMGVQPTHIHPRSCCFSFS